MYDSAAYLATMAKATSTDDQIIRYAVQSLIGADGVDRVLRAYYEAESVSRN